MSKAYKHISFSERRHIYRLQDQKLSVREIAFVMGRHPSSIYREVQRNTFWHEERSHRGYFPVTAQELTQQRRARLCKLLRYTALRDHVIGKLRDYWSPEQICGHLRRTGAADSVCHETVYRYVYSANGREAALYQLLFRGRKNRRRRFGRVAYGTVIPYENTIHARPDEIDGRAVFGHWEGDLMIFERSRGNANVTTLVERKTRYTVIMKNDGRRSSTVIPSIGARLAVFPAPARRSITFDRGFEFMRYRLLKQDQGITSYFCDPSSPWQKGAVENANSRLRRFLPRETDLSALGDADINNICEIANATPRKCLGYRTPKEVFEAHLQGMDEPLPFAA